MSDVSAPAVLGLGRLEERLADPEPLCLALLSIEPRSAAEDPSSPPEPALAPALTEAVSVRLRDSLRAYDELRLIADGRFAIILPTLATREALEARLDELYEAVDAPYRLAGDEYGIRVLLGAAVRAPGEPPSEFLARVVACLDAAEAGDGHGPVVI